MPDNPTRRCFLKTSIAAGAASSSFAGAKPGEAYSGKGQPLAPLRLGLMTYNLARDWDLGTIIKNCLETKWEHVELRAGPSSRCRDCSFQDRTAVGP